MADIVKDKVAFEAEHGGYRFEAWYLTAPKGDAFVEISKDGEVVKSIVGAKPKAALLKELEGII